jgi:hypothetical protein
MTYKIVFRFTYNILENIFLKYLPHHKFFIMHSSGMCLKFDTIQEIIGYIISKTTIYFYKFVYISIQSEEHIIYTKTFNLFRNIMAFDNYIHNLLEKFMKIKIQKNINNKLCELSIVFKNFLGNEISMNIYKSYHDNTILFIESSAYSFSPIQITNSSLIEDIFMYFLNENDYVSIYINKKKIFSSMYKNHENTIKSTCIQKYLFNIIRKFEESIKVLNIMYNMNVQYSARIIQKQVLKSLYDPEYKLCKKILEKIFQEYILKN